MAPRAARRDEGVARVLAAAADASRDVAQGDLFYRQLAIHLAKQATSEFHRSVESRGVDGAGAVAAYVSHEEAKGRLARREITVKGEGLQVRADVHQCPYQSTCQGNLRALGEVPQCLRAITLIEAITRRIPDRPPMTYDLEPGLVDGTSAACAIELRPAGLVPVKATL